MTKQQIALAVICYRDTFLLAVRGTGHLAGYYEFVGGKVENGESPESALVRELDEELGLLAEKTQLSALGVSTHCYPKVGELCFFVYRLVLSEQSYQLIKDKSTGRQNQPLLWLNKDELLAAKDKFPAANQAMFAWL